MDADKTNPAWGSEVTDAELYQLVEGLESSPAWGSDVDDSALEQLGFAVDRILECRPPSPFAVPHRVEGQLPFDTPHQHLKEYIFKRVCGMLPLTHPSRPTNFDDCPNRWTPTDKWYTEGYLTMRTKVAHLNRGCLYCEWCHTILDVVWTDIRSAVLKERIARGVRPSRLFDF